MTVGHRPPDLLSASIIGNRHFIRKGPGVIAMSLGRLGGPLWRRRERARTYRQATGLALRASHGLCAE
jgi:hypothetical protein